MRVVALLLELRNLNAEEDAEHDDREAHEEKKWYNQE